MGLRRPSAGLPSAYNPLSVMGTRALANFILCFIGTQRCAVSAVLLGPIAKAHQFSSIDWGRVLTTHVDTPGGLQIGR
eukprot:4739357-Pyramimonas_sp.AAC.1